MPAANPAVVVPPAQGVWRVARGPNPLDAQRPDPATLISSKTGNRFDSPDGSYGVLYFGSALTVCFGEVLARKRPDPALAKLVEAEWRGYSFMEIGAVPRDWRDRRSIVKVALPTDMAYLDVDHPNTHEFLRRELALGLAALGADDLNIGVVRGQDRRITRLISTWAWSQGDDDGRPTYAGVRYASKIDNDWECWAIFDDVDLEVLDTKPVTLEPELLAVADRFGLRMH